MTDQTAAPPDEAAKPETAPATGRRKPDWELAERLYRAGQLSNVQIAAQIGGVSEGAVRKVAKLRGWTKDLSEQVRQAVHERLVRGEVRSLDAKVRDERTDRQIIEQAAENAVAVVRAHRRDLATGLAIIATLMAQLRDAAEHREALLAIGVEQAGDGPDASQRVAALKKALSLPVHAAVARDLATAIVKVQSAERIAWGLNAPEKDDLPEYERRLIRIGSELQPGAGEEIEAQ